MLLLAAGVLIHWVFVVVFAAVLAGVALICLPGSIRSRREPGGFARSPTARLAKILAGGAALGTLGLIAFLSAEPSPPRLPRQTFQTKLGFDAPKYAFPLTAPLAAIGVAALARIPADRPDRTPARRRGLWLALVWAGTAAGAVVLLVAGSPVPAHRFLAFAMGIPLLVAAGLTGAARALRGRVAGTAGLALGAFVVVAGIVASVVLGFRAWSGAHPWIPERQAAQAATAGRYLRAVPGDAPVVFLVDLAGATPLSSTSEAFHVIRSGLPASEIARTLVYLGDPGDFLAGRPTLRPSPPTFDESSLQHWPSVRAVLDEHPIALMMPSLNRGFAAAVRAHPDWLVAPGLVVIEGPRATALTGSAPTVPAPLGGVKLALLTAAFLLTLAVLGSGWSVSLVEADWLERTALAPAFGIAALVVGGVIADRLGLGLTGGPAVGLVLVVAALGWAAVSAVRVRRR